MGRSVFARGFSIQQECCVHSAGMVGEKATGSWNTGQSLRNKMSTAIRLLCWGLSLKKHRFLAGGKGTCSPFGICFWRTMSETERRWQ